MGLIRKSKGSKLVEWVKKNRVPEPFIDMKDLTIVAQLRAIKYQGDIAHYINTMSDDEFLQALISK